MKVTAIKTRFFAGRKFNPVVVMSPLVQTFHDVISNNVTVIRKKDGVVVAENVTVDEADAMIAKAKAGKKAALMIK